MNRLTVSAVARPTERAAGLADALRVEIQAAEISTLPVIAGALEELRVEIQLRLGAPRNLTPPEAADDRLLTAEQVAARLHQKTRWVYDHRNELPIVQLPGRSLRFSEIGLNSYIQRRLAS